MILLVENCQSESFLSWRTLTWTTSGSRRETCQSLRPALQLKLQVEVPVDMEVELSADAEMPDLVAFLRRDAMFTGERFGEVQASDGSKETAPLSFQTTFGQLIQSTS